MKLCLEAIQWVSRVDFGLSGECVLSNLTVVIPTVGRINHLSTTLRLLRFQFGKSLRIIVYVNSESDSAFASIALLPYDHETYKATTVRNSADESTLEALKYVTEGYVWILGDDDIPLGHGMTTLLEEVKKNSNEILFFDSVWMKPLGQSIPGVSLMNFTHSEDILLRDFILKTGFNYLFTGMGKLVIKRDLINLQEWENVIDKGDSVFSYVINLLYQQPNANLHYVHVPIIKYRTGNYHWGDSTSWAEYTKQREILRHHPWTTGLTLHLKHLRDSEVLTSKQIRLAMVCERQYSHRFVDEITHHLMYQLENSENFFSENSFYAIMSFVWSVWPDMANFWMLYEDSALKILSGTKVDPNSTSELWEVLHGENYPHQYRSLMIEKIGYVEIYEHLDGYLCLNTKKADSPQGAYSILNPKLVTSSCWKLFTELSDARDFATELSGGNVDYLVNKHFRELQKTATTNASETGKIRFLIRPIYRRLPIRIRIWIKKNY